MLKKLITILIVLLLLWVWLFYTSKSRSFQFFGWLINNIHTDKSIIALTFDDGPTSGNTEKILDILKKHDIKASFFLIGNEIEKNPEQTIAIVQAWHQVGNHSYSHTRMVLKSPQFIRNEISRTDSLIQEAWYTGTIHFRTPYGKRLIIAPYILRSLTKANIFFDVEPETYVQWSWAILEYILHHTHSGSIILLHPMYREDQNQSLEILDTLIKKLKEQWFHFVTIDQLLSETHTKVDFR